MAVKKIVMLADSSMTLEKLSAPGARQILSRLDPYGVELVFVQDQKGWTRKDFTDYASLVEKTGPESFDPNPELLKEAKDADIILANFAPVGSKVIDAAEHLGMIGVTRSGAENVNVTCAKERGIQVAVSPGRLSDPVADFTVGLMLAESRNIGRLDLAHGVDWQAVPPNQDYVRSLKNAVVGLIGYGIIGQKVAKRVQAFGCTTVAYDPFCPAEIFAQTGTASVPLEELMGTSDFVSVHARLTPETKGLVTRGLIALMKPTAYFINTARADLVDEDALAEALYTHKIGGAGLDVFSIEPLGDEHLLRKCDNVTLTPHRAGNCCNLAELSLDILLDDVQHFLSGHPLLHPAR
jgi:D-3-phosphoglycerate dehydrogenase